ncbi:autotransporter outer membrane beta-barrel domain-containing protein [Martelella mediterranea]|uniref:Putative autotransporter n=1 Tax=Martelella mediterranea DSM 17316 TaxID=1122214 RepID=A0A1U9Z3U5_9HYPH|nr:autotransporter outer membrane beta-barrel domain-containing protein [Martelella mediterranea]AQZ52373.1 putative autotransporter precursor [Martelella mediterranea DSM 17316]
MTLFEAKVRGGRMTKVAGNAASYAPRATASVLALSMLALSSGAAYFGTGVSSAFAANECGVASGPNAVINCTDNEPYGITYNNLQGATVTLDSPSMRIGNGFLNTRGVRLTSSGGNALTLNADSYDRIYWPVVLQGDGAVAANFSGGEVRGGVLATANIVVTLAAGGTADHIGTVNLDGTTVSIGSALTSGTSAVIVNGNADGSEMAATITGGSSISIGGNNAFGVRLTGSGVGNTGSVVVDGASQISASNSVNIDISDPGLHKATAISVETSGASSSGYVSLSGDADVSASATNALTLAVATGISNTAGDGGVETIVDNASLSSTATSLLTSNAIGIDNQSTGGMAKATVKGGGSIWADADSLVTIGSGIQSWATAIRNVSDSQAAIVYVGESATLEAEADNLLGNATASGIINEGGLAGIVILEDGTITATGSATGRTEATGIANTAADGVAGVGGSASTLTVVATSSLGEAVAISVDNVAVLGDAEVAFEDGSQVNALADGLTNAQAVALNNDSQQGNASVRVDSASALHAEAIGGVEASASGVINSAGLEAIVILDEGTVTATGSAAGRTAATAVINTAADGFAGVGGSASTLTASATSTAGQALATAADNVSVMGDAEVIFQDATAVSATANGSSNAQAFAITNESQQGEAAVRVDTASTVDADATSTNSYAVATAIENRAETEARIRIRGGSTITATATGAASAGLGGFAAKSTGLLNASTAGDASTVIDDMSGVSAEAYSTTDNTSALAVNTFTSLGEARTVLDNGSKADALAQSQLDATALAVRNFSYDGGSRVELDNGSSISASADSVAGSASATGIMAVGVGGDAIVRLLGASDVSVDVSGSDVYAYGVMNTLSGAGMAGVAIDAGSVVDVGTFDQAGTTAYVTGVSNSAKDPLGMAYAAIKGLVSGTADALGVAEVFGVVNAASGGEAVIELSESAEVIAEGTSANDIATAVAVDNTNSAGLAKGVVAGAGRVTAFAEGALDTDATGFNNASANGNAALYLAETGSVSATGISDTASTEVKALNNLANDGDAYVELLDASLASAEADGQTATARAVANEVHGAGEAFLNLSAGSTLLAKATASDDARAAGATNFANEAGGMATAMVGGLIAVGADGDDEVEAGGVWNSSRFGDARMGVLGTSDIKVDVVGALAGSATGLRNVTGEGKARLVVDAGASIGVSAIGANYAEATGAENIAAGDGSARSSLAGMVSTSASSASGDAEAIGLYTETDGPGNAEAGVASTASITATSTATNGVASSIGVASQVFGSGDAYASSESGSSIETSATGSFGTLAIGIGALGVNGNATVVTGGDIALDASSAGDIFAAGAIAQVNNGGMASLTMTGGSITASASGAAAGLGTFTLGTGATYAINVLGGSVSADIGIKTDSEAGQTGTVMIGSDAAITAAGGHDGMALVDLDGAVTVTSTGTVVGTAWLGAGDDTFNLAGGSWTGDIQGEDGNDAFNWTGGALNSGFYGGAGNDTAYLGGGAIYDGTEVFDGGDGVDALTFDGVSATTAGSLIANWETFSLDNTMLTLTGGAITVGSTSDASQGIYLNGSTLQVNQSTVFNGNMFLNAGSTLSSVDGATGDAMTVTGNLTGGGTLAIDVDLANAVGDTLTVNGAYLGGVTTLSLNELSTGYASGKSIEIITLDGGEQGAFVLPGYNVSGAYAYALSEVGNQYFLTGDFSNATPVYEVLPELMLTLNRPDSLQDRVGERYWNLGDVSDPGYVWADFTGGREHYDGSEGTLNASYNADIYRLRMGVDGQFGETESGFAVGGLVFQYANATADVSSRVGGGDVVSQLFGLGATMTWYGNNGFYVDGQAFGNVINNDLTIAGTSTLNMQQSYGYSLSAETGYRFDVAPGWAMTPQAQLTWGSVNFDDFTGVYNEDVSLVNGDSLAARMGLQTDYRTSWTTATGEARSASLHGIANVYYDFTNDPSEVWVSGVNMSTDDGDWTGEIGIGGSYTWLNGKLGINGDVTASTGLENFGDSYGLTGKVRFQMQW